jgi:ribosomal protein S18 acetylase RimI-like enzyme
MRTELYPETIVQGTLDPSLAIRNFRDRSDFGPMTRVLHASYHADGIEESRTVEAVTAFYESRKNIEMERDLWLVEHAGELVAYSGGRWWQTADQTFVHAAWIMALPEWRGQGIEQQLLAKFQARVHEIASNHPPGAIHWLQMFLRESQTWLINLAAADGYQPVRYFYEMVRPDLENILDSLLPPEVQVRPILPEHYRKVWDATVDIFSGDWEEPNHDESDYERWLKSPHFDPTMWQVAWVGDEVVGHVLNFVDDDENRQYHRKRGHTEDIGVRKAWRRRGIARALLVRSLHMFRDMGFDSTTLGVDVQNPNNALRLYESAGYVREQTTIAYRREM